MKKEKLISKVGFDYGVFVFIVITLQVVISLVIRKYWMDFARENTAMISLAMTVVIEYIAGFGTLLLLLKKVPKMTIKPKKLGVGNGIAAFMMMYALMEAGGLLGNYFQLRLTGDVSNDAVGVMLSTNIIPRVLVIGILAPIVEELIFRKLLIDRLIRCGVLVTVLASGLMFGLIHGNFGQFFYAFFLGSFFAAIYILTGKIRYTIIYHMIINISSSIIGVYVLADYEKKGLGSIPYMLYSFLLVGFSLAGVVLIIIKSKDFVPKNDKVCLYRNDNEVNEGETKECVLSDYLKADLGLAADASENTVKAELKKQNAIGSLFANWGMFFFFVMIIIQFLLNYEVIGL